MAVFDLEEQEKIDSLKAWWEKWGNVVTAIVFVVSLIFVGRFAWIWWHKHQAENALPYYESIVMTDLNNAGGVERLQSAAVTLENDYASTGYAPRGALLAAQRLLDKGQMDDAKVHLNWLIDTNKDPSIEPVARLNLASVLADKGEFDVALGLLKPVNQDFEFLFKDREADVLYLKGDRVEAKTIWTDLLNNTELPASLKALIEMKLNTLGD